MSLGPIMLDVRGLQLEADEIELLQHAYVGGVILFSRNYESPEQVEALTREIHAVREPRLLVAVDHEGGRVQRFRQGFTHLPACRKLGEVFEQDEKEGLRLAEIAGWLMAAELRAVDIDFSFAPILDLYKGISDVIGDRAFHRDPDIAARLAKRYIAGMNQAGMQATGKHFPGHGSVVEDSHLAIPNDHRSYADIQMDDLRPFQSLSESGMAAIMPAHVIYPEIDPHPAGFSPFWLQTVLRQQLNFNGVIFSDDISMAGAEVAGTYCQRAMAALQAGCDMVLVCNQQDEAKKLLDELDISINPVATARLMRMQGKPFMNRTELLASRQWQQAIDELQDILPQPESQP